NVSLIADLEMHLCANGYVGLCRLEDGKTNVCGLFRRKKGERDSAQALPERLRGERGTILYERLGGAQFEVDSFCSVGGLDLRPCRAANSTECCVGDSLTMIPPITGNGMSMAFEAAECALAPLVGYARGETDWNSAHQTVARNCDRVFASRLMWAKWLQTLMFTPLTRGLLPMALNCEGLWELLFRRTR